MYLELRMLKLINMREKVSSADNQQGSRRSGDPSETIRRAPSSLKLGSRRRLLLLYFRCDSEDDDIVHAL